MNKLSPHQFPSTAGPLRSALFELHPLPGFVIEPHSLHIVQANKAALAFYGYSAEELNNLGFAGLFHPLGQLTVVEELKNSGAAEWKGEALQVKKNGDKVMAEVFLSVIEVDGACLWQVAVTDATRWNIIQQEALAETGKYKIFIEQSSEGIFCQQFRTPVSVHLPVEQIVELLYTDCYISECNTSMARMYGFEEPYDLIGALSGQLLDLSDSANIEYIRAFVQNGFRLSDAESHEKDRFGQDKYFLNNIIGIVQNGCLVCIWGTQRDITDRKKADKETRMLANLVEQTSDVLTSTDLQLRPTTWNAAAEKIYGVPAQSALGNQLTDLLDLSYPGSSSEEVKRTIIAEGAWRGEVCFTRPTDGRKVTILAGFKLMNDEDGSPLGYLVTGTDITERKETEMKLRESENRFRYIADTAPVMIWICDASNKTTYTSKHWMNFTGVDIVRDPCAGWSGVVHPEDVGEAGKVFDEHFELRQSILLTYRIRTRDGSYRWVQDTGVPRFLEDGTFVGYIGCIVDIHDTKSKEEQLQQQAVILEQVTDIIVTIDREGKVIGFNRAAEQYFSVKGTEVLGRRASEFFRFHYGDYTKDEVFALLERENTWSGEVSFINAAGETHYLLHTATNVFNDKGEKIGIMSVSHDITDRKLSDRKLQQSEAFYRSLIADSLDGMLLADSAGAITFVSPSVRHILGFEPEEVAGRNAFDFVHPDDVRFAWESFQKEVKENPEYKFIVVRLLKKSGDWLWCSVRGHNLLNNPYVNSLAIYFHDDTLRKKASDALKQSEKRFRTLISDLQIGISLYDASGELVICNRTYSGLLNSTEEEMQGKQVLELFPQAFKEDGTPFLPEERPLYKAAHTKKPVHDAVMGLDLDCSGERTWLLVNIDLVLDENENVVQLINSVIDITERKKLEQRLLDEQINKQKLLTQASIDGQEKERKEIGKELHDNIGQQLTTTKLFLDLAKSSADDTTAEMISMALKGISDVINEVRRMSRSLMPPTLGDLGLMESVSDLVETISRTQYLRIDLDDYEFDEEKVADNKKLMIFRIIQEQLNNIVKHAEAQKVSVLLRNDKAFLLLEIKDDGKGFDPKGVRKGLGLTNMRNRAELFGGEVKITSAPGKGCTLTVKVPHSLQRIAF
ncbi:MAG TPA: PAS domain S-box protein [Chitinophagaceae bacterium]